MGDREDFSTAFQRLLEDAHARMDGGPPLVTADEPAIVVRKLAAYVPVSCCAMTDNTGINYCREHAPLQPAPWHRRLRWAISSWWARLRMRVGSRIAGVDLDREDDR